jgi:hypothetical protein
MGKAVLICATVACGWLLAASADARSFGGYECKRSCAGYARGYRWAERAHVKDPRLCEVTNSKALRAGCMVYTQDPTRGADTDDNGVPFE